MNATDDTVDLVTEVWLKPGGSELLKASRPHMLDIFEHYGLEYVYHGHPFAWVFENEHTPLPTGIEIFRCASESIAKEAIHALETAGLLDKTSAMFSRVRCYLSRYALPPHLTHTASFHQG